jgi:hypothetical protein
MQTQPRRRYASLQARRGREAYVQIRTQLHRLRTLHIEPKAVWVNQATADAMHALWAEVCNVPNTQRTGYDGKLPSVAGVSVHVGMTGGDDYVFEYFDTPAESHQARDVMDALFKVQDNPLDGTH